MSLQISFKNSRGLTLVGTLWQASSDCIIIMVHGSDGNKLANGLFPKIALALQEENYNVLTFDFSGHGESDDDIFSLKKSIDDLLSAIEYATSHGYKKIILFGHSFGALTCLEALALRSEASRRVRLSSIKTMILLGGMTGPVHWKWEDFCSPDELKIIQNNGYAITEVNDDFRKIVKSDIGILDELAQVDQEKIMSTINCPVLLIHGDADQLESGFLELSKKALLLLPKESELKIIPGASHTFLDKIAEIITLTKTWLKT